VDLLPNRPRPQQGPERDGAVASPLWLALSRRVSPMRMRDWLQQRAHLTPDKLALAAERGALTFRQLDLAVERAAALFTSLGVKPRDHVAALLGNDLPAAVAVHALIRCGAVMVPINLRLTPGEMSWQARDAEARWILHDAARETVAR